MKRFTSLEDTVKINNEFRPKYYEVFPLAPFHFYSVSGYSDLTASEWAQVLGNVRVDDPGQAEVAAAITLKFQGYNSPGLEDILNNVEGNNQRFHSSKNDLISRNVFSLQALAEDLAPFPRIGTPLAPAPATAGNGTLSSGRRRSWLITRGRLWRSTPSTNW